MPDPIVPPAAQTPAPAAAAPQPAKPAVPATPEPQKPGAVPAAPQMVPVHALQDERDKRQASEKAVTDLRAELDALKKVVGTNVYFDANGRPVGIQPQPAPVNDVQAQVEKLWESDPRKAVQAEIYSAITWLDNIQANIDDQVTALEAKYPDFGQYRAQTRQYLRMLPLDKREQPGVAEMAFYAVRGQQLDSVIAKTKEQLEAEWLAKYQRGEIAGGLPAGSMGAPIVPQGGVQLTPDELKVCEVMGIKAEDYIKNKVASVAR